MVVRPIPRRTSDIELWDNVPVGTRAAWQREMLQFWALNLTKGRRLRTPAYMMTRNSETNRLQPRSVREVAALLARRIKSEADHINSPITMAIEEWLADSLVVPGERAKGVVGFPAAGLSVPHFIGLGLFAKGVTRERYWATTFYLWLAADQAHSDLTGEGGVAESLRRFLGAGLRLDEDLDGLAGKPLQWAITPGALSNKDPEVLLTARALASGANDGLPSLKHGLGKEYFNLARQVLDPSKDKFTILCPGSVVLMRRGTQLLLERSDSLGHGAMAHMVETGLAHAAAQYYVRGMRVLNDLVRRRTLPGDCANCWTRFADDLNPIPLHDGREERWLRGSYHGGATAEDAQYVEDTCASPYSLFLNAGTKEDASAKDLGRISLENLRQQLAEYTVNRLWMNVAWGIADELASQIPGASKPATVADVLPVLDAIYANSAATLLVAREWKSRIRTLITDKDVPGSVIDEVLDAIEDPRMTPGQLEDLAKMVIAESILSTRYFGRYVEVLNSIVGGGALPSNQDAKGMIARGGRSKLPFHLSINDSLLEYLVAVTSLEAKAAGKALSFSEFLDRLSNRYLLDIDRAPSHLPAGSGLAAEAISESRQGIRGRLAAMGFLEEFSDSSSWNRVEWVR